MSTGQPGLRPLLLLVGPTASGKTSLALALAQSWKMEVVSMDSRQVYRGMDVGTAKPTRAQRDKVPHHLVDVVDPDDPFDATRFAALASNALDGIISGGRVPVVVGGTGLYMRALLDGFFQGPGRHERVRQRLVALGRERGTAFLHSRLAAVDPPAARRVHPNDLVRLVRALEVYEVTGRPMSELWRSAPGQPYRCRPLVLGLSIDLERLDARIEARAHAMMREGFVAEVEYLLRRGYSTDLVSMSAVGYRAVAAYVAGTLSREEAVDRLIRGTCRYARRQYRWFRADTRVAWLQEQDPEGLAQDVRRYWRAHIAES